MMPLDTKSFDLFRTLPLDKSRLWHVLTDAQTREKWNGPDAATILVTDVADLRVGGLERHRFGPKDTPEFLVETRWYDLAPHERAVFTETLIFGGAAVCTSLVTYVLDGTGNQTDLSITVAVSSFSGAEALDEVGQGWAGAMDSLDAYAKGLAQPM